MSNDGKYGGDSASSTADIVSDGDYIVLERYGGYMRTHRITSKRPSVSLGREIVDLTKVMGCEYGSPFKMCPDAAKKQGWILEPLAGGTAGDEDGDDDEFNEEELLPDQSGSDNRDLLDLASMSDSTTTGQRMTAAMIESLREERVEGSEILGRLVENSSSFKGKTRYSQEKFIKKKARKYSQKVLIRKPSIRLLHQIHYRTDPIKILNLRMDSLALLLSSANLHGGSSSSSSAGNDDPADHFLIYEAGCQGLLVAAALERVMDQRRRTGSSAKVVQLYCTGNPQSQCVQAMNFQQEDLDRNLALINLYHLRSLEQGVDITKDHLRKSPENGDKAEEASKKPYRQLLREQSSRTYQMMKAKKASGLILACRHHPAEIVLTLIEYLGLSRPFAIFCPYKEPLMDTFFTLKSSGRAVMMTLFETWLRNYQVLPERTHPEVLMSGGGGYILTGISVDPDANADAAAEGSAQADQTSSAEGSGRKGRKNKRFRRR